MRVEKDVATVLALEEPTKALLKAIKAAKPAIKRLSTANFPGAGWVSDNLDDCGPGGQLATPGKLAGAVKMFRESAGDQAAFDYLFYVADMGTDLTGAALAVLDEGGDDDTAMRRVEALRQYAATIAS
jgi:hypothetical protein